MLVCASIIPPNNCVLTQVRPPACGQLLVPVDDPSTPLAALGQGRRMGELTNEDLREPFRGSKAVVAGTITRRQLRGTSVRRVFRDVYVPAATRITHEAAVGARP